MKLPSNPPIDERLLAAQHRAGYYAFMTMFIILLHLGIGWALVPEYVTPAVMYFAIFLPGVIVFLVSIARAGWFTHMRESANASPKSRRLSLLVLLIQTVFFSTMMGLFHHFFIVDDYTATARESIMYGASVGLFWGLAMGAFYVFRFRRGKIEEED